MLSSGRGAFVSLGTLSTLFLSAFFLYMNAAAAPAIANTKTRGTVTAAAVFVLLS